MRGDLLGVEGDAYRHTLYDLDPVAGGILRRQQCESGAGTQTEARDRATVLDVSAVEIGYDLHRLPDPHTVELDLFEVCLDPQAIERHDRQQGIARDRALAELRGSLGDVT